MYKEALVYPDIKELPFKVAVNEGAAQAGQGPPQSIPVSP